VTELIGSEVLRGSVLADWIDLNDHMNVAYYVLAFDQGVDRMWGRIGIDDDYVSRNRASTFAVDCHVTWQRELMLDDPYIVTTEIVAYDAKRIQQFMRMYHARGGFLAATGEWLNLHVDLTRRKVAPWPASILRNIDEFVAAQPASARPPEACARIAVPKPRFKLWADSNV